MHGINFDIAHMLAGSLVLVSFMQLYQDRLYALLNTFADRGDAEILACVVNGHDADNASAAAISAINQASLNYFFLKPWDPPAEHLYPQLDDLLDDWQASYHPVFEGVRACRLDQVAFDDELVVHARRRGPPVR